MRTSTLIYNPIAGRRPARREKEILLAAEILRRAGTDVELAPTDGPGSASDLASRAVSQGRDQILVCGGDGTINEVINGLVGSEIPLGVLPGGTANILAREMGLPLNPVRAAAQLPNWSPRRVPLGRATWFVDGASTQKTRATRFFMSVAGIGFDAHVIRELSPKAKMSWGVTGYIAEAFRQVFHYPFQRFSCRTEDGATGLATFAVVQRARNYGGWLHLTPGARFFDRRFTLCLFKSRNRARYFLYAAAVLARQHARLRDVKLVETSKVCCTADARETIHFELDGELGGMLPVTFEVVPEALRLLAP